MPPTRIENIKRKAKYTDNALRRATQHLADLHTTVGTQHQDASTLLLDLARDIDAVRRRLLDVYRDLWGGTEQGLWKAQDFDIIMNDGIVIPDPKRR